MGSESDEILIEDSDDSLLDFKELNDVEFDLPQVTPPSLESVLCDMGSEEGSDSASLNSLQSITSKLHSMLYHCILQGLSAQISSASERVNAGLPTCITNSLKYVTIGTSHGYVLTFDAEQNLCWCFCDSTLQDQGAISALALNLDSTRLLVGYERGLISMIDAKNGDVVRKLPDAHAPQTAVLHLRFTFLNNLALCGDSSGCVFSLSFNRRLGIRTWDSKCLFSGARGEVCIFEPLIHSPDIQFLNTHTVIALATLSKVIIITIRPKLRVLFSQQLPRNAMCLPLISWQLVVVGRNLQPVLAWGRGDELNYTRLTHSTTNRRLRLVPLRSVRLSYTMLGLNWLGNRHMAILDGSENLRLVDVRSQQEVEALEMADAGLVYGTAHFKALAVGGGVSEAFALAGERACYNSLSNRGDQLLVLGTKAVHMVKLRTWPERLLYLSKQGKWAEALNLAGNEGSNKERFTTVLLMNYLEDLNRNVVDKESLYAAVNCCVKLNKTEILCNDLFDAVSQDEISQSHYFTLIIDHIISGKLSHLTPTVSQALISHLEEKDAEMLETILLTLDISCLDLHQALKICKQRSLYDAWIRITTRTTGDFASPLIEFLLDLSPDNHRLGNTMLVYVSSCLAGLGYPNGNIPEKDVPRAKHEVLRCLETVHSINPNDDEPIYPYLRKLLKYNTRECLNVVELAFTQAEFSGEMGLLQRQRLIEILLKIVIPYEFTDSQIINLACFITRLIITGDLKPDEDILKIVVGILTEKSRESLSLRDHNEREQSWLDLLHSGQLNNYDLFLKKALDAKCYRIVEHLYEKDKNYYGILNCYLNDQLRHSEIFNYILNYINVKERRINEQFIKHFPELVKINSKKTAEIVVEHFLDSLESFVLILSDRVLKYRFLSELVDCDTVRLPGQIACQYLELLCENNSEKVCAYLQTNSIEPEEALEIVRRFDHHRACALLLERCGEWHEALKLLLEYGNVDEAIGVCARGAEHLDADGAQQLWLFLLEHPESTRTVSLRRLLHSAAPHVPPERLLELVSHASFGDVKGLIEGVLADYRYDVGMLEVTLKLLDKDLHHGLAKCLCVQRKGVAFRSTLCRLCKKPLVSGKDLDGGRGVIVVWGCGDGFHKDCIETEDCNTCPKCRHRGVYVKYDQKVSSSSTNMVNSHGRPDLEGHF